MIRIDDTHLDADAFEAKADALARLHRLTPEGRYAVCPAEPLTWLALFSAARRSGASTLPIHPATPYAQARTLAERAGCDGFIYHERPLETLKPAAPPAPLGALLQMSSGTTGAPKCVARAYGEIEAEIESYVATFRAPEDMTPIVACPTTHSYGLICGTLVALKRGATPIVTTTDNPKYIQRLLRETDRPLLYSSPAMLHTLARLQPAAEPIHAIMTSGTLLPEPWFQVLREKTVHLFQQYGCSEAGCIAINPDMRTSAAMGFVLPHHRLVAPGTAETPAEIVVESYGRTIRTSDLGFVGDDGMLTFIARQDDTINVAGINVYPSDIEDAVTAMPGVSDAVAFRRSDALAGERVALVFSADDETGPDAVRRWCADRLARHQVPMDIVRLDAVPRQPNGKISRREVAALHAKGALRAEPERVADDA